MRQGGGDAYHVRGAVRDGTKPTQAPAAVTAKAVAPKVASPQAVGVQQKGVLGVPTSWVNLLGNLYTARLVECSQTSLLVCSSAAIAAVAPSVCGL